MVELLNVPRSKPLLKWAGGKSWLTEELKALLPKAYGRYYEPFCGGAAAFFNLRPTCAQLSDSNAELINCYLQVRDEPEAVISALKQLKNSETDYYRIRESRPRSEIRRAARMVYLTTLSFNGIYRVNHRAQFNVPYGYKDHLQPGDAARINAASELLQDVDLFHADFEDAVALAKEGDVIYFDPPYTVAHGNNGFIKYNERILQWNDQLRLAQVAMAASEKGCRVIVSNANHPSVRELYKNFRLRLVHRPSVIAASSKFRREITECVFHN